MQVQTASGSRWHDQSRLHQDRTAISTLTNEMTKSWNLGDGHAYGRLFTQDCDYIAFDGTHLKGRGENARHHQSLFDTILKGSRLVFEGEPIVRFLSPDVALMHAMGSVLMPWQGQVTASRRSNQTYVVVREADDCWRITAFHNTRYRPFRMPSGWKLAVVLFLVRARARIAWSSASAASAARVAADLPPTGQLIRLAWSLLREYAPRARAIKS